MMARLEQCEAQGLYVERAEMSEGASKIASGFVSLLMLVSMTGCVETYRTLYLKTIPEGAVISADNGNMAPKTSSMVVDYYTSKLKSHRVNGCAPLGSYTATWPSGAKTSTGALQWCNLDKFNMSVTLERPKDSPNIELDKKAGKDYVAQQTAEAERANKETQAKYEYERSNPLPPAEDASDDGDISMSDALSQIAGAYAATQAPSGSNSQNRAARAQALAMQKQSQWSSSQQASLASQGTSSTQANTVDSDSKASPYDYDASHPQCVTYGRHPTLSAYAQYRNSCAYAVSVTYCSILENGRDNCENKIFGSFELKAGGVNIAEGSDISVKYIVCKLPYHAIGSQTTVSGGQLSAPCQKNK